MADTKKLESWWSGLNAQVVISVRYPTLWLTPFLDLPLTARGIESAFDIRGAWPWAMGVLVELLGVSCGDNAVEAWVTKASKLQRWLTSSLYVVYFAATTFFVMEAADRRAVVFPLLGVVGVLGAAAQAWRQVAKDDRAARAAKSLVKADQQAAQPDRPLVQIVNQPVMVGQQPAQPAQLPVWKRPELPAPDRVRAWIDGNPNQSWRQGQRDTGIPWSSFRVLAKEVTEGGQVVEGSVKR